MLGFLINDALTAQDNAKKGGKSVHDNSIDTRRDGNSIIA